jgi:hypothetical protein
VKTDQFFLEGAGCPRYCDRFLFLFFFFTKLTTQNLCSVSILKRGATVITHFWVIPQFTFFPLFKKNNNTTVKGECQNAQKIVKIWLRRFKNTKTKI